MGERCPENCGFLCQVQRSRVVASVVLVVVKLAQDGVRMITAMGHKNIVKVVAEVNGVQEDLLFPHLHLILSLCQCPPLCQYRPQCQVHHHAHVDAVVMI